MQHGSPGGTGRRASPAALAATVTVLVVAIGFATNVGSAGIPTNLPWVRVLAWAMVTALTPLAAWLTLLQVRGESRPDMTDQPVRPDGMALDEYLDAVRRANTFLDLTTVPGTAVARRTIEHQFVEPTLASVDGPRLSARALLDQPGPSVVIGESGAGKSALLQYLAWTCAGTGDLVPFLVPLKEFPLAGVGGAPTHEFVRHAAVRLGLELPDPVVDELLRAGRCLLLLDGFDEVPPGQPRSRVIGALRALAAVIKHGNRFVVTSRPADQHELNDPGDLHQPRFFRLDGFGFAEIERFATRWYGSAGNHADRVTAFVQAVRMPQLDRLARNPLYLTIMAVLGQDELELVVKQPNKLFDALTQHMLQRDQSKRVGAHPDTASERRKRSRLGAVARTLQEPPVTVDSRSGNRRLVEDGLVAFLTTTEQLPPADAVDEAERFLRWCVERSGLLVEPTYEFRHAMLRQYFAATSLYHEAVDSAGSPARAIVARAFDPRWDDGIHFLVDQPGVGVRTATEVVSTILGTPHEYREITRNNVLAAVRVMAACHDVLNEARANVLDEFLIVLGLDEDAMREHWLSGSWRRTYREALSLVPLLRGSSSEPALVTRLLELVAGDGGSEVRMRSCEVLGALGSPDARVVTSLLELMRSDGEPTVADTAGRALADIARFHESVQRTLRDIMSNPGTDRRLEAHTWRALLQLHLAFDLTLEFVLSRQKKADRRHKMGQWTDAAKRGRNDPDSSWDTDERVVLDRLAEALHSERKLDAILAVRKLRIGAPNIRAALHTLASTDEADKIREQAASTLRLLDTPNKQPQPRATGAEVRAEVVTAQGDASVYAGEVTHRWSQPGTAFVKVAETITVGSRIRIRAPRTPGRIPTDFTQHVESMMYKRRQIDEAEPGMAVSITFSQHVRPGDQVYLLARG